MCVWQVANSTTAAFIRVVGSEFVQKYLGEGPRMVRDVFRLAKENEPAVRALRVSHWGMIVCRSASHRSRVACVCLCVCV